MAVTISATAEAAERVRILELRSPVGAALPAWRPGEHLELTLPSGLIRRYSLCGDPSDRDRYRIAVLCEPGGRGGSVELHRLRAGATIHMAGPRPHFPMAVAPRYTFVAGGIGITPLLPMIRQAHRMGSDWRATYLGKSVKSMAFLDELSAYGDRVNVHFSEGHPRFNLESLYSDALDSEVYVCGPESLIETVRRAHTIHGGSPKSLHFELFRSSAKLGEESHMRTAPPESTVMDAFDVQIGPGGPLVRVPPDRSVLSQLLRSGIQVPFSCEEGVCGTCEVTVLAGKPDHRDELFDDDAHARGAFLLCVSRSRSPVLVLDLQDR